MPNTLATPSWTMKEVTRGFLNKITFVRNVNRTYDDQYKQAGAKVGNTVKARLPQRYVVTDGQALQLQNLLDETVPITLTNQKNVAFGYSSAQATTELDNIRQRYVDPATDALANAADVLAFENVYRDVYNSIGVPGTTPATRMLYLHAGVKLTDLATPPQGRVAVLDPLAMATISDTNATLFNPQRAISDSYRTGQIGGRALGIDAWFEDPNRPLHTTGTFTASTPLVNGASQTGSSLITDGWASGATSLLKGDIFTVGGVYSVNPQSRVSTGRLQQFVVTANITDTTGDMTIAISPSIITSGAHQTVSGSPATGAAITVWSAAAVGGSLSTTVCPTGMVYHPDAFAFVMADLIQPGAGAKSTTVRSKQWGVAIRMVEQYQIGTDQNPSRLDMMIGAATVQARLACRATG